jgi:hypothetical protein
LGFQGLKDWRPISDPRLHLPRLGPTPTALKQHRCGQEFERVWRLFGDDDRAMLTSIILRNTAVMRFAAQAGLRPNSVQERLVAALGRLALHFDIAPVRWAA